MSPWALLNPNHSPSPRGLVWVDRCYYCDELAVAREVAWTDAEGREVSRYLCFDHDGFHDLHDVLVECIAKIGKCYGSEEAVRALGALEAIERKVRPADRAETGRR